VLTFPKRADASIAGQARTEVLELIDAGRTRLVFDLSEVGFDDSSALSVLVTSVRKARAAGGDVALAGITDPVRSLIELTRLQHTFSMFDDVAAAVKHFATNG
jgi:anti-sigma B factor antagonist